jgi:16S rRNA (adenine1518-N6/adenine1519-N6)-dimethyltransferase
MTARIPPKKSLGQHFLADRNILAGIVDLLGLEAGQDVVEIGPGPGGLTRALLERGCRVLAVEIDPRCCEALRETLGGEPEFRLVQADALTADFPGLLREAGYRLPVTVAGNFPYNVGTALLRRILPRREWLRRVGGLLQDEVVQRLAAAPGTPAYGYLTLYAWYFAATSPGARIRPGAFRPPPKVLSRTFRADVRPAPLLPPEGEARYLELISAAFAAPRKTLANNLRRVGWPPHPLQDFLSGRGLSADARPAALAPEDYLELARQPRPADSGPGRS